MGDKCEQTKHSTAVVRTVTASCGRMYEIHTNLFPLLYPLNVHTWMSVVSSYKALRLRDLLSHAVDQIFPKDTSIVKIHNQLSGVS